MQVISVRFEQDGTILVDWHEPREQTRYGGEVRQTYITHEAANMNPQIQYWMDEIQDDCIELLSEYQKSQTQDRLPGV